MKLQHCLLGFAVASMVVVVACKSDEEQQKEDAAKAEAEAQETFTTTYCEIVMECCNLVLKLPKDAPAQTTCKKRINELDPMMVKDLKARTDCIAQLRAVASRDDFCPEFGNLPQPACPDLSRKLLVGAKKVGEACTGDPECAPSFDGPVACKGAICQVTKRGKEGDGPCISTIEGDIEFKGKEETGKELFVCYLTRDELLCDTTSKKCMKPVALNAECTDTNQCVRTAYCDPDEKKCKTKKATNSACVEGGEQCQGLCEGGFCASLPKEGEACTAEKPCTRAGTGAAELECRGGKCEKPLPDARLNATCVDKK